MLAVADVEGHLPPLGELVGYLPRLPRLILVSLVLGTRASVTRVVAGVRLTLGPVTSLCFDASC